MTDGRTWTPLLCDYCKEQAVWLVTDRYDPSEIHVCEYHKYRAFS
jgi:hypothetical protein